jgi:phage recombination protein Bet
MADNVTALAVPQPHALARPMEFSPDQRKMIRDSFANGASDSEFAVLMEIAKARSLNPLLRQIHFVNRWDSNKGCKVWSTQISIDGLRAVAERTGKYDGQDEPVYEYDKDGKLTACKVRVFRKDWSPGRGAVGVAFFTEYAQTKKDGGLTSFWATKPHIMLAKCAEALAIRKAFPEDTSGLYVAEEMGAPEAEPVAAPVIAPPQPQLAAAAKVLEAEVVKPETPKPAESRMPPPYVTALWNRAKKELGTEAKAKFEVAATSVFRDEAKPTHKWTKEDCASVEAALFPRDVAF